MNLRKFAFISFMLIAACLPALAQTDSVSVKTIDAKTTKYNSEHPVEKVYLHFDKPYYALGDTIWFKAYLTIDLHMPSVLSKVIYVDVISSQDSIVQTLKLPVAGSTAFGNVMLTAPLYRQGNYHFRAYTKWMRNFDPAYFFNKTVAVGSIIDKDVFTDFSLSGAVKNNAAKVDAGIHYTTPDGRPYTGKKVNWKVQNSDDETISKGKVTTDATGNVNITFTTAKIDELKSATLFTTIDLDTKPVNNSFSLKHAASPMDVQFFPESGDLVNGIQSKVAFKAIKPDGLGVDIKGTVTDNNGAVVASITSQHLGMGVFDLLPESGKTYKASVTFPDGTQNTYNLPQAKADGITLAVTNTDPYRIGITISASDAFFQTNKMVSIIGQNGQIVCFAANIPLKNKVYAVSIPKNKFPTGTGVTKLTIFSVKGDVLAERLVFIKADDLLNVTLNSAKPIYTGREKVTINVSAKKPDQQPSQADLSVTVLDETKVPVDENAETTILTSLLLTSDLKGYIEKPNYYFNHTTDKTNADLDILMLTQGYRRFSYKDILADNIPPTKFMPEVNGMEISGTLRSADGMPVKGNVNLAIKDKHIFKNTITNPVGEFTFSKLYFPDSVEAVISAKGNYNSNNFMIMLNNDSFQPPTVNTAAPDEVTNIDTALISYLKNNKQQTINSHVLKEVVIRATTPVKKPSHTDYPELIGLSMDADEVIDGSHLDGCPNIMECLKGWANALMFDTDNLYVRKDYNLGNKAPVQIYLNQMPVDFSYLASITPAEVESVEVFLTDGVSGINKRTGTNGVLVINSKKIPKVQMSKDEIKAMMASTQNSSQTFMPKGYSLARVFYSPRYDLSPNAPIGGDLRSTIYWSPKILTDKNGNASFNFFNADGKGSYRVIIEGIDGDGNIGRTVYRYKVQ